MTIFKSQKVADLEARVAELESENAAQAESLTAANERLESVADAEQIIAALTAENAEIPDLNATITAQAATIAGHVATIEKLTAENVVTSEKIATAAAEKLAAMGHGKPLDLGKEGMAENVKTHSEFNALTPAARLAYVKAGGKITA